MCGQMSADVLAGGVVYVQKLVEGDTIVLEVGERVFAVGLKDRSHPLAAEDKVAGYGAFVFDPGQKIHHP